MIRNLSAAVALAVVIASGVMHGLETSRWGINTELVEAAARLAKIPNVIGDWSSTELEIPKPQLDMAGAVSHFSRAYVNRQDGTTVNVMILCGPPGPMSVHPPTVCFTGAGWGLTGNPQVKDIPGEGKNSLGRFWQGDFMRDAGGIPQRIQTLWSWSTAGDWRAIASPRKTFAGKRYLYKMYLTISSTDRAETTSNDARAKFLAVFLPRVNSILKAAT